MEPARAGTDSGDARFDGLHAEAQAAIASSAETLHGVRERYQEAYAEALRQWVALRQELDAANAVSVGEPGPTAARLRALTDEVDGLSVDLGDHRAELGNLELAERALEHTLLFLERGHGTLVSMADDRGNIADLQMHVMEALEIERSRLAREIHDGPAQALSNAIFQVEYIERVVSDPLLVRTELRALDESLRRALDAVRAFINQVRPPMLDELGLEGAIEEAVEGARAPAGLTIATELSAPTGLLTVRQRAVVLRVVQEALQNVRKHAAATNVTVATRLADDGWELEVRDDGRGFDTGSIAAPGRRNFGLQFMRERAELIGARLDVRSRPEGGTVVRLAIPTGAGMGEEENT